MIKMITIIMSTYNTEEKILRQSIESILNQTYKNFEFIIINDGGNLDRKIINEYTDKRIKIIDHENNKGLPTSLNEGIQLANGKYIVRMDSDDIAKKNRLEIQLKYMEKNMDTDICGMFAKKIGERNDYSLTPLYAKEEIKCQLLFKTMLIHPTVMIRTEFLKKNNLKYNEEFKYAQDFEFWSRCIEKCNIAIIPRVGLKLRIHNKQVSTEKKFEQEEYYLKTLKNNIKKANFNIDIEELVDTFKILSGKEKLTNKNCINLVESINKLVQNNNYYNKKVFEIVLNNALFNVFIKRCMVDIKILVTLKNVQVRKRIFNFSNLILMTKRLLLIIKCSFI